MALNILVSWQLSKQETRWPHRGLRPSLWGFLLDGEVTQENKQVNLGQLMHAAYIIAIWCGRSISWSIDSCHNKVSADQYPMTVSRAQSVELTEVKCFLKFTADRVLNFHWIAGSSIFTKY